MDMIATSPNKSISFRDVGYTRVLMVSFLSVGLCAAAAVAAL